MIRTQADEKPKFFRTFFKFEFEVGNSPFVSRKMIGATLRFKGTLRFGESAVGFLAASRLKSERTEKKSRKEVESHSNVWIPGALYCFLAEN